MTSARAAEWTPDLYDAVGALAPGREGLYRFRIAPFVESPGRLVFDERYRSSASETFPMRGRVEAIRHPILGEVLSASYPDDASLELVLRDGRTIEVGMEESAGKSPTPGCEMIDDWTMEVRFVPIACARADALAGALISGRLAEPAWTAAAEAILENDLELGTEARRVLKAGGGASVPAFRRVFAEGGPEQRVEAALGLAAAAPRSAETMDALLALVREGDHWAASRAALRAVELGCPPGTIGDAIARFDAEHVAALIHWVVKGCPSSAEPLRVLLAHPASSVSGGARRYFSP